ncbi:heme-dependent oxidative N-demethylase family protein [Roseobacter sp.]|uniref:heme-dependent oxidative N-demethylase family protein n=1 Tax=Roseobacter sp. TaxID=1907202 RepID=UPI0038591926
MTEILQDRIPLDMREKRALPGIQALDPRAWLHVDEAYSGQMAYRRSLIQTRRNDVYWLEPAAENAAEEVLAEVIPHLSALGFTLSGSDCRCPDGNVVDLQSDAPLIVLGNLLQEDICIMDKRDRAHVLVGAILCFPASWRLSEKVGRPLIGIHDTVDEYDDRLAQRIQRLFDGVQVGRPLWRYNRLWYDDPDLYQPRSANEPRQITPGEARANYQRAERQSILRLPVTKSVVFSIHTYVAARSTK